MQLGTTHLTTAEHLGNTLSRKEQRAQENEACLGGMRNPRFAVEKLPGLRDAGDVLRTSLEEFIDKQSASFIDHLLGDKAADMASRVSEDVSLHVAAALGCSNRR